jgi:hypothetical protein
MLNDLHVCCFIDLLSQIQEKWDFIFIIENLLSELIFMENSYSHN